MDGFCFFCTVYLILSGLTPRHLEIQALYHLSGIYERYLPLSRVETNPSDQHRAGISVGRRGEPYCARDHRER
jgi:hypothetical protein